MSTSSAVAPAPAAQPEPAPAAQPTAQPAPAAPQETDTDLLSFGLIADAGEAKSLAFMALAEAKKGNFDAADAIMEQSGAAYLNAHHKQTELLVKEANGDHTPVNVMLVHAQDHLMNACQARELVAEFIALYRLVFPIVNQS